MWDVGALGMNGSDNTCPQSRLHVEKKGTIMSGEPARQKEKVKVCAYLEERCKCACALFCSHCSFSTAHSLAHSKWRQQQTNGLRFK